MSNRSYDFTNSSESDVPSVDEVEQREERSKGEQEVDLHESTIDEATRKKFEVHKIIFWVMTNLQNGTWNHQQNCAVRTTAKSITFLM